MELLFKIMVGIVIAFIALVVYACIKVSSRCSRYEDYTIQDIDDICRDYQCNVNISNGNVVNFVMNSEVID